MLHIIIPENFKKIIFFFIYNLIKKIYNNIIQNMHVVKNKNKKIFIKNIFKYFYTHVI